MINSINSSIDFGSAIHRARSDLQQNMQRLSSGRRINNASDDAAGLAVSERMSADISSLIQASRNTSDGISLIQVADSGLANQGDMLSRMRELAVQSANGTLSDDQRASIHEEFGALRDELNRTSNTTTFNDRQLLTGGSVTLQVGSDAGDSITVTTPESTSESLGIDDLDLGSQASAQAALESIDGAIDQVSSSRGDLGATVNRLNSTYSEIGAQIQNTAASYSRVADADIAGESSSMASNQFKMESSIAMQRHANLTKGLLLNLIA